MKCEAGHNAAASWFLDFEDGTKRIPLCEMHGKVIRDALDQVTVLRGKSVKADLDLQEARKTVEQLQKDATCYEEEIDRLEQRIDEQNKQTKDLEKETEDLKRNLKNQIRKEKRRQARTKTLQVSKLEEQI